MDLRPGLEGVSEDATATEEWVQRFSMLLELVYSLGADTGQNVAIDLEISKFLGEVRYHIFHHASAAWLDHSPRVVAGMEEQLRQQAVGALSTRAPTSLPQSALRSLEPSLAALLSTPNSSALRSAALATSPSGPQPGRQAAAAAAASPVEPLPSRRASFKRGRSPELMNVSSIDGYTRCDSCIQSKVKCAPLVGSSPPYPCARCVNAQRDCVRSSTTRRRRKRSAVKSLGATPTLEGPSAATLLGEYGELSGVDLVSTIVYWRTELSRSIAMRKGLDEQIEFARRQCAAALGNIAVPDSSSGGPRVKRARTRACSKGKERVVDVDELEEGEDGTGEEEWGGLTENFGDE